MTEYCFNVGDVGFDPVYLRYWDTVILMLAQLLQRWSYIKEKPVHTNKQETFTQCRYSVSQSSPRRQPNIVPTLGERLVFAGLCLITAVKKSYVERAVPPLLGGMVSKAVAQH